MADECPLTLDKRCEATKATTSRSHSASSMDGITTRRTLTDICRESAEANQPSRCCTGREEFYSQHEDASTIPWFIIHRETPPPPQPEQYGYREGFHINVFFMKLSRGREALKCNLPPKNL